MSGAHTPGPWRVNQPERILGCDTRGQRYIHAKDVTVAAMLDGEREANARLIAAAPDLLAAAIAVLEAYGKSASSLPIGSAKREALMRLRDARDAAIAKAGGSLGEEVAA